MHSRHGACVLTRSAQRSRALRAGKYAWGDEGKNTCPDGTTRIDDFTACKAAAAAAQMPAPQRETKEFFPKGCYSTFISVYFNAHATGAATTTTLMLCAVTGVPASPARPADGRPARAPVDAVTLLGIRYGTHRH
jgi:hypothetical protein